jgi:hypothetical protein
VSDAAPKDAIPYGFITVDVSLTPEQLAELAANFREQLKKRTVPIVLAPGAVELRRRTPAERRAYLLEHRDEAITHGIPEDLVDWMIQDAEGETP